LPEDREAFEAALLRADVQGVDTAQAREELKELDERSETPQRYVAFFGPISSGKSALIQAITGDQSVTVDPRGGTTRVVRHYQYDSHGENLLLSDAPGILDINEEHVQIAREEARRAHLVVYVCDGELTRDQHQELTMLREFNRPLMLALNKQDRYDELELNAVMQRIGEQVPGIELVPVQAGGQEEVIRVDTAGNEKRELRNRPPKVESLVKAMLDRIEKCAEQLDQQRDESLLHLGAEKLYTATQVHRKNQGEKLVKEYTRKAMVGALAAVTPGTDVLIQGYLGVKMVGAICELHGLRVRDIDLEQLVDQVSQNVDRRMTLILALVGNILKAFPGMGTVTGGIAHAVAYGLIFEALGASVVMTLEKGVGLVAADVLDNFEETMSGNLEERAKHLARLTLEQIVKKD
jgi:small GTP-binding protein